MFKKILGKIFKPRNRKEEDEKREATLTKLNQSLYPSDNLKVVYEEITKHTIKDVTYKLGDKVICRSNECDPLTIGVIVEFWDNGGKWGNPIPQVKDENGDIWGIMGALRPYSEELMTTLEPMRPLEQWNYLLPDNVKEMYSYTEEEMVKKEKQYNSVQKIKEKMV